MKLANDVYQETKYAKEIIDFKKTIEESIDRAASNGNYECNVSFSNDIPDSIRDKIRNELERLGYRVSIPKYEAKPAGCPYEQWGYYDEAKINWEK